MKENSQRESKGDSGTPSQPQKRRLEHSCAECGNVSCLSIHESAVSECPLEGCYICADLARIDDKISTVYKQFSDLVQERQKIVAKPCHDPSINRLPVEILSSIFVSAKDAIIDFNFKDYYDVAVPKPWYRQPYQSPPLLVGAVCKRWRDITLTTPRLWTDIIVNLMKSAVGQLDMVTRWARRAGALPLDITIFIGHGDRETEEEVSEEVEGVLWALRQVAVRWNDIALRIPGFICVELLNNLPEIPAIGTLFLDAYSSLNIAEHQHPFRPRRLISKCISIMDIPFEWDRLVFVEISDADDGEILHIIRHAHNLRHCIATAHDPFLNNEIPPPTTPLTNHSLIYLHLTYNIIGHLNLPSLLYLDYNLDPEILDESFDSVVEFINRSRPPLDKFILRLDVLPDEEGEEGPLLPFEKLPGITSLLIDYPDRGHINAGDPSESWMDDLFQGLTRRPSLPAFLPRLEELRGPCFNMSESSWSSFTHLFRKGSNLAELESDLASDTSIATRKSLSKVQIYVRDPVLALDRETFLSLLEVKKSGVDLDVRILGKGDFFEYMASIYGVEL